METISPYTDKVTGIILAGGKNTRMNGRNKAFIEFEGERLVDRTVRIFKALFEEVILVTNSPLEYLDQNIMMVADIYKDRGALGGIHAGLLHAGCEKAFFAACDMPFLNQPFIASMIDLANQYDIVVPNPADGLQPLHAIYPRKCLPLIEKLFAQNKLKIIGFYPGHTIHKIPVEVLATFDPEGKMFANLNSLEELKKVIPPPEGAP
ncbi:MAG: molybdenum cofactor guanylyltransferase [Syntrophales bacterium]|jgi:molybdopterin-guanine dinucleotide biosynthesis protein A|nr:molybdenum cofactor guanylyltransferase [Syntrophales bacterium]NLN60328.1 molybdenum cofactor guanylyltransferase [Deltaproteobacteria bacterium]